MSDRSRYPDHPDDEVELPDVHTVPLGSVAVFGGTRPAAVPTQPTPPRRPDIESPFLDFFGRPTVDGALVDPTPAPPGLPAVPSQDPPHHPAGPPPGPARPDRAARPDPAARPDLSALAGPPAPRQAGRQPTRQAGAPDLERLNPAGSCGERRRRPRASRAGREPSAGDRSPRGRAGARPRRRRPRSTWRIRPRAGHCRPGGRRHLEPTGTARWSGAGRRARLPGHQPNRQTTTATAGGTRPSTPPSTAPAGR